MNNLLNSQGGFVQIIVIVLVALVIFSFFGVDLRQVFQSELFQKNMAFLWETIKNLWTTYVYNPAANFFTPKEGSATEATGVVITE